MNSLLEEEKEAGINPADLVDLLKGPHFQNVFSRKWLNNGSREKTLELFCSTVLYSLGDIAYDLLFCNCFSGALSGKISDLDQESQKTVRCCNLLRKFLEERNGWEKSI